MFCPKCGNKNDNSAAFCQTCGYKFNNNNTSAGQTSGLILKSHESAFIIIVGVVSLINGGVSILTGMGLRTLSAQTIGFAVGLIDVIFGIGALLKQRWAFIALTIAYGIQSVFQVLGTFFSGDIFQAVRPNSMIINILITAYYIALLAFSYICSDALSQNEQSMRNYEAAKPKKR